MNRPTGRVATCTEIMEMTRGSVRYMKKVLRKERRTQETSPNDHIRNVHTGRLGSSSFETVRRTSSIGETSSFSSTAPDSSSNVDDAIEKRGVSFYGAAVLCLYVYICSHSNCSTLKNEKREQRY